MPPPVAALLTVAFIAFLFVRERGRTGEVSGALWLPVLWLAITGSRFVSQWVELTGGGGGVDVHEGNPIDALYFLTLIVVGVWVLARRRIALREILRNNVWIAAFFIYSFLAIAWSDFPFVAFKRWIKVMGHPVMALIILTDADPVHAFRIVMKRCAFLLMPLSVLLIKYYPEFGRGFSPWTGEAYNNGVMLNKNELGYGCMIFALFLFWNLLIARRIPGRRARREEAALSIGLLCMTGWLLYMAHSATAQVATVVGLLTIWATGLRIVGRRRIALYVVGAAGIIAAAAFTLGLYQVILELLGRDPTLTDRTKLWADCLALVDNPLLGAGFESFWLGSRLDVLWAQWLWQPNQAHSGYIETYLNLGVMGVLLLAGALVATFRKISRQMTTDFWWARFCLAALCAILFYNYSEAAFKGVHPVWTLFHIVAIHCPVRALRKRRSAVRWQGARTAVPNPVRREWPA
jgi:O-antigen ligase